MRKKKQGLRLGDTDYKVSFHVKDTLGIFGMEGDNNLDFSGHISNVRKKNTFNIQLYHMAPYGPECAFIVKLLGKSL